jgi:hypothetical protein
LLTLPSTCLRSLTTSSKAWASLVSGIPRYRSRWWTNSIGKALGSSRGFFRCPLRQGAQRTARSRHTPFCTAWKASIQGAEEGGVGRGVVDTFRTLV